MLLGLWWPLALVQPAVAQSPRLVVIAPKDGAVVVGRSVTVVVEVHGLAVVPAPTSPGRAAPDPEVNRPGEGHLLLGLDLRPLVTWDRLTPYTFADVPAGPHHLTVELVQNDATPFTPPVVESVRFRTEDPGAAGAPSEPAHLPAASPSPLTPPTPTAAPAAHADAELVEVARVWPDPLNVRAAPGLAAPVVTTLQEGTRARRLDQAEVGPGDTWWQLAPVDGTAPLGWSLARFLVPVANHPGAAPLPAK